jgi:hypothetical protein
LPAPRQVTAAAAAAMAAKHGAASVRAYVANAVHFVAALRGPARPGDDAAGAGLGLLGVFEDDLVPGTCPAAAGWRVAAAIAQLPPTADMLYLEVGGGGASLTSMYASGARLLHACCCGLRMSARGSPQYPPRRREEARGHPQHPPVERSLVCERPRAPPLLRSSRGGSYKVFVCVRACVVSEILTASQPASQTDRRTDGQS